MRAAGWPSQQTSWLSHDTEIHLPSSYFTVTLEKGGTITVIMWVVDVCGCERVGDRYGKGWVMCMERGVDGSGEGC